MKHKCIDCAHCDVKKMKCFPQSKDFATEYNLTEEDLNTYDTCMGFKPKLNKYIVCVAVEGRTYVDVEAVDIHEARRKANDKVNEFDFGALEDIEWGAVYAELDEEEPD